MQDHIGIPNCFFSQSSNSEKLNDINHDHDQYSHDHDHHHHQNHGHDTNPTAVTRSGQSVVMSTYRTKIAGRSRLITITWCKNLLLHGLSVSIHGNESTESQYTCKVELKPWYFWRKHGSKKLLLVDDDKDKDQVTIFWDLKAARFHGETEPSSGYFVAVVFEEEVVLLVGDLKKEGYKRTGCRPALIDPILVSKKEHVFGKRRFSTRARFHERGKFHEISIECKNSVSCGSSNSSNGFVEPEMEIRLDGQVLIHVKHLQWKFRGNELIHVNSLKVEVFWDVHDWLFSPGLRHALFIFKPVFSSSSSLSSVSSSLSSSSSSPPLSFESWSGGGSSEFCLFLYAWKVE